MPDSTNITGAAASISADPVIRKYLATYAESESRHLPALKQYEHVIVIPAFRESWPSLRSVWASQPGNALIVIVINTPEFEDLPTLQLVSDLRQHCPRLASSGPIEIRRDGDHDLLIVDRFSEGRRIPANLGVGLARKIGADIALALIASGQVRQNRISLTDGDVVLPADYTDITMAPEDAALIFPFVHVPEPQAGIACLLYEIRLFYYAAGLRWAGSPYGFTTVGSTIAVNALHYARVRGVPRRNAGEDFYLLNKLAKSGHIRSLREPTIRIQGRLSDRVPIGTGPGLKAIVSLTDPMTSYGYYHPEIFVQLGGFHRWLYSLWDKSDTPPPPGTEAFCETQGLLDTMDKRRAQITSRPVFEQFVREWFDGFRTLKFVHSRQQQFKDIPVSAIRGAPFAAATDDLQEMRDQLAHYCTTQ